MVNKTLLGGTLVATFLCGGVSGYATRDLQGHEAPPRHSVEYIYADQFERLRAEGYSEEELDQAREIYQDYFDAYDKWWKTFMETHRSNFAEVDARLERRLEELDSRVQDRTGE